MLKRDFAILIVSAFAIYFTIQHEGAFTFRKAWYHSLDQDVGSLELTDVLPPPVAADLNGDGRVEVITATHNARLHVIGPRRPGHTGEGFSKAALLADVSLLPEGPNQDPVGHRAVALATGYLDARHDELVLAPRKQVVVVVTSHWDVLCFDHNLRLMWTGKVKGDLPEHRHASVREVAVHISNHSMQVGDRGVVVVGASAELGDLAHMGSAGEGRDEDPLEMELAAELSQEEFHRPGEEGQKLDDPLGPEAVDLSRHFSYYAFEGRSGALRWKHEGMDFHRDAEGLRDEMVPQHNIKITASSLEGRHYGEVACRDFRESVLAVMPHRWARLADTQLRLAHFHHHRPHKGARKHRVGEATPEATARPHRPPRDRSTAGLGHRNPVAKAMGQVAALAMRGGAPGRGPTSKHTYQAPNVLVAHLEEGIEAVHLYSGRTLCKLHLPPPGLHADLNGDGVLDHVQAAGGRGSSEVHSSTGHKHIPGCWAIARSGIPAHEPLFNGTICRHPGRWGQLAQSRGFTFGSDGGVEHLEVAPPAFLPVPGSLGLYQQGHGLTVFLNSRGEVTAYDPHGEQMWQHAFGLAWSTSRSRSPYMHVVPTLEAMSLRRGGIPNVILAAGAGSASIMSEHGHQLDTIHLPGKPVLPLQAVDFNGDQLQDIVVMTYDAIYGWAQVRHPGGVPFAVLMACLIVAMLAVYITQQAPTRQRRAVKGRSTDRVD